MTIDPDYNDPDKRPSRHDLPDDVGDDIGEDTPPELEKPRGSKIDNPGHGTGGSELPRPKGSEVDNPARRGKRGEGPDA